MRTVILRAWSARVFIVTLVLQIFVQTSWAGELLRYQVQDGDNIFQLLYRLKLHPLKGPGGTLKKTLQLNGAVVDQAGDFKNPGKTIQLPVSTLPKSKEYTVSQGWVVLKTRPTRRELTLTSKTSTVQNSKQTRKKKKNQKKENEAQVVKEAQVAKQEAKNSQDKSKPKVLARKVTLTDSERKEAEMDQAGLTFQNSTIENLNVEHHTVEKIYRIEDTSSEQEKRATQAEIERARVEQLKEESRIEEAKIEQKKLEIREKELELAAEREENQDENKEEMNDLKNELKELRRELASSNESKAKSDKLESESQGEKTPPKELPRPKVKQTVKKIPLFSRAPRRGRVIESKSLLDQPRTRVSVKGEDSEWLIEKMEGIGVIPIYTDGNGIQNAQLVTDLGGKYENTVVEVSLRRSDSLSEDVETIMSELGIRPMVGLSEFYVNARAILPLTLSSPLSLPLTSEDQDDGDRVTDSFLEIKVNKRDKLAKRVSEYVRSLGVNIVYAPDGDMQNVFVLQRLGAGLHSPKLMVNLNRSDPLTQQVSPVLLSLGIHSSIGYRGRITNAQIFVPLSPVFEPPHIVLSTHQDDQISREIAASASELKIQPRAFHGIIPIHSNARLLWGVVPRVYPEGHPKEGQPLDPDDPLLVGLSPEQIEEQFPRDPASMELSVEEKISETLSDISGFDLAASILGTQRVIQSTGTNSLKATVYSDPGAGLSLLGSYQVNRKWAAALEADLGVVSFVAPSGYTLSQSDSFFYRLELKPFYHLTDSFEGGLRLGLERNFILRSEGTSMNVDSVDSYAGGLAMRWGLLDLESLDLGLSGGVKVFAPATVGSGLYKTRTGYGADLALDCLIPMWGSQAIRGQLKGSVQTLRPAISTQFDYIFHLTIGWDWDLRTEEPASGN